jgi:hypothetical protein
MVRYVYWDLSNLIFEDTLILAFFLNNICRHRPFL